MWLSTLIDARVGAGQERENNPLGVNHDDYDNDLDPEPERQSPLQTLSDADTRVVEAYAARGMNGERALARIKGSMDATKETFGHWHDQEVRERMKAGDLPRSEAEREIQELHELAVGTYQAATRAISRGVSLEAEEMNGPRDPPAIREPALEQDFERDRGEAISAESVSEDGSLGRSQTLPSEQHTPSPKPTRAEFLKQLEDQERALLKADAERARERGIENAPDLDDGFDL